MNNYSTHIHELMFSRCFVYVYIQLTCNLHCGCALCSYCTISPQNEEDAGSDDSDSEGDEFRPSDLSDDDVSEDSDEDYSSLSEKDSESGEHDEMYHSVH